MFIDKGTVVHTISQSIEVDSQENLWNVSAEIAGVLAAVEWLSIKNLMLYPFIMITRP
ncbi:hypothetical protein [Priestia flexa]|uniref:hypothetical protein n=1 Tax=Priestia flexa TaxID=86664 RepID=UPI0012948103|nr:hypothetical protein [Priestia flexa]